MSEIEVPPPHLKESSLVTSHELRIKQRWLELVASSCEETGGDRLDGWLCTSLPFSFRYGGRESSLTLPRWQQDASGWEKDHDVKVMTWTDAASGLRLTWRVRSFTDYPAVEWVLRFENIGSKETALIEDVQSLRLRLNHSKPGEAYFVHGANGGRSLPDDLMPLSWRLPSDDSRRQGEAELGGDHPSSNRHLPFFNVETPEDRGVLVGVGWSGRWLAKIKVEGTQLTSLVGLKESRFTLRPGERVRTPGILLLFWEGARLHGHNMLRQVLRKYYIPRLRGRPQEPLVSVNVCFTYHGGGGFLHEADEEKVLPLVKPLINLGVELLIIDAGWYKGEPWHDWMGDWKHDEGKYPRGFRPISEPLMEAGVPLGLWFASELVSSNAPVWREHPEWLRPANDWRRGGTLRMEAPEAREWFLQQVRSLVEKELMGCFRQDGAGTYDPEPEYRRGVSETAHITGLYALWDTLIQRHPCLVMEGCSGGGRRIDLETLSRFHWHQKSDRWYDSESDQCGLYGANLYLPGGVVNVPTERTDDYGVWSSFAGQLCLGWHPLDEGFPVDLARLQVERYKRVRRLLSGDYYPLTPCSLEEPWLGFQFHRVDLDEGFVLLFRRSSSARAVYHVSDRFQLLLRGLDPGNLYDVHLERSNVDQRMTGETLSKGIEIIVKEAPGAEMILYKPFK